MKAHALALSAFLSFTFPLWSGDLTPLDSELKKTWPKNRTIKIVFHGHSVPSGYHRTPVVKPFESYPHLFRVRINERYPHAVVNVITTSIGGEDSIAGAARFKADVLTLKPDFILLDYGLNDRRKTPAAVETAWRSMVADAKTAGVPIMLMTPTGATNADLANPSDPLAERAELIRSIARDEDVLLADVSAAWLAALENGVLQTALLSQSNHPNLQGHTVAVDAIFPSFVRATE